MITQRTWRTIGAVSLLLAVGMVVGGRRMSYPAYPLWALAAYWGFFLLLLLIALYMAVLDLKFIRLQYLLGRRQIFQETLGSEDFRTALRRTGGKDGDDS